MIYRSILAVSLAIALLAIPGASAADSDADSSSCAAGGDLPLYFWYLRIYSGQCVGVELEQRDPAPFRCPEPDMLPCGYKNVVSWN